VTVFASLLLWFGSIAAANGQDRGSVALYRLTRCCPESAWTDAEYAAIKELDAMDVSVTLLDRGTDAEEGLEQEIETIGKSGNYSVLLYFFKNMSKGQVGVRVAVFKKNGEKVEIRHLVYTTQPSTNAMSIVTLKAVEAAREAVSGPALTVVPPDLPDDSLSNNASTTVSNPSKTEPPKTADPIVDEKAESKSEAKEQDFPIPKKEKERGTREHVSIVPHRFALGLGPVGLWSPQSDFAFALQAAVNMRIVDKLFVELNIGGIITAKGFYQPDPRDDTGESKILGTYHAVLFRTVFFWSFLSDKRVHPMLGVVGGAVLTVAERSYDFDNRVQTDTETVGLIGAEGRLGIDVSSHFGVVFGVQVALYVPEVKFNLTEDDAFYIGRPLLNGFCNVEYRF
jgi:hypothetical protein